MPLCHWSLPHDADDFDAFRHGLFLNIYYGCCYQAMFLLVIWGHCKSALEDSMQSDIFRYSFGLLKL